MASLNKVFLMGNLTREPELRYTPNGSAVASFGLAVNRRYKAGDELKEETCFLDITVWNKQAETCSEYLKKGSPVLIEGRLSYRTWETEEGQKRSKLDVVAVNVQFLPKSSGSAAQPGSNMSYSSNEPTSPKNTDFATRGQQQAVPEIEDDVPF